MLSNSSLSMLLWMIICPFDFLSAMQWNFFLNRLTKSFASLKFPLTTVEHLILFLHLTLFLGHITVMMILFFLGCLGSSEHTHNSFGKPHILHISLKVALHLQEIEKRFSQGNYSSVFWFQWLIKHWFLFQVSSFLSFSSLHSESLKNRD